MKRLTSKATAAALKVTAEGLQAAGVEVPVSDQRYIKLAEYEDREEEKVCGGFRNYSAPWYNYYFEALIYDPDIDDIKKLNITIFNDRDLTEKYIYMLAMEKAFDSLVNNERLLRLDFKTRHEWR